MSPSHNTSPSHTSPTAPQPPTDRRRAASTPAIVGRREEGHTSSALPRRSRQSRRFVLSARDSSFASRRLGDHGGWRRRILLQELHRHVVEEESDDDFSRMLRCSSTSTLSRRSPYRGSLPGRAAALDRKRERDHDQLYNDYFQPTPLFVPSLFRRRFRMTRPLFRRIMDGVKIYDDYFCAKVDAIGKIGLSSYQKCTTAIRMLAYGVAGDFVDEYTRMSESTGLESMYSIDRMHWEWKNCPFGWRGHTTAILRGAVILEAVASHDTWIWHSFFGMAGSHNDINVLQRSPVFDRLAYGKSPNVDFEINGHHYTKGYYLSDGIYPPWDTLVKTIRNPNSEQEARFAKEQEAAGKMSSERLASSKLVGLSSDTLPEPGMCKLCGR
ncbi:hypothetical protein QYE76_011931 [Lolium multiflorum]|uniref:Uncharacterized protein n=1 Tax=Lolium multiflorum TaxID=4521 RepID=A0AAD8U0S5_LOLMU|nr:hypothetical protein QYE76_011931 [Lolium multiflorum]